MMNEETYAQNMVDKLEKLGISVNDGTQDINTIEGYQINLSKPICPCCGKLLKPIHNNVDTETFIGESLNEETEKCYVCEVADGSNGWLKKDGTIAKFYGSSYKFLSISKAKEFAINYVKTNDTTIIIEEVKIKYYKPTFKNIMIIRPTSNRKQVEVETIDGKVYESLNESAESMFLTQKVKEIANALYEDELNDVEPEVDNFGNITPDYLNRFKYCTPELKRAVRRAATKLSYELKDYGFNINPWYCEVEIFDALKCFSK